MRKALLPLASTIVLALMALVGSAEAGSIQGTVKLRPNGSDFSWCSRLLVFATLHFVDDRMDCAGGEPAAGCSPIAAAEPRLVTVDAVPKLPDQSIWSYEMSIRAADRVELSAMCDPVSDRTYAVKPKGGWSQGFALGELDSVRRNFRVRIAYVPRNIDHVVPDLAYARHFEGHLAGRYTYAREDGQEVTDYVFFPPHQSFREASDAMWSTRGPEACERLHAMVQSRLNTWIACTPGTPEDLLVRPDGPNRFRLLYVVRKTQAIFVVRQDTFLGEWADPPIVVSFDTLVETVIRFSEGFSLEPRGLVAGPAYFESVRIRLANAFVWSIHPWVNAFASGDLREQEAAINRIQEDLTRLEADKLGNALSAAIVERAKLLPRPGGGANGDFELTVSVEDNNWMLHYRRDGIPPAAPTGCRVVDTTCSGDVTIECDSLPADTWVDGGYTIYIDLATRRIGLHVDGSAWGIHQTFDICAGNAAGVNCHPEVRVDTGGCTGEYTPPIERCPSGLVRCGQTCRPITECNFLE